MGKSIYRHINYAKQPFSLKYKRVLYGGILTVVVAVVFLSVVFGRETPMSAVGSYAPISQPAAAQYKTFDITVGGLTLSLTVEYNGNGGADD